MFVHVSLCQHHVSTVKVGSTISASHSHLPAWEMQYHYRELDFPTVILNVWLLLAEILEFGTWHWILMFVNIGLWILMLALLKTVVKPVEITVVNVMF